MTSNRIPPNGPNLPQQSAEFVCWGCQNTLPNVERMRLDDQTPIPVCAKCWGLMPVSERIKHAQAFSDRAKGGIISEVRDLVASSFGSFFEQRGISRNDSN